MTKISKAGENPSSPVPGPSPPLTTSIKMEASDKAADNAEKPADDTHDSSSTPAAGESMKPGGSHPLPNLPADEDELEADVDLVLPRRRRRASDDEDGSEGGFHDAVESVGEAESAGAACWPAAEQGIGHHQMQA